MKIETDRYEKVLFDDNPPDTAFAAQHLPAYDLPVGIQPYASIARHFFPSVTDGRYPRYGVPRDRDAFYRAYSEPVSAILNDVRFCSMLFHFEKWALGKRGDGTPAASPFRIPGVGLELTAKEGEGGMAFRLNAYGGPLIRLTQVFYALNCLGWGNEWVVRVCLHKTCRKPFATHNPDTKYCSDRCRANAQMMRKRINRAKREEEGARNVIVIKPPQWAATNKASVRLRGTPSANGTILATIPSAGTYIQITDVPTSGFWSAAYGWPRRTRPGSCICASRSCPSRIIMTIPAQKGCPGGREIALAIP